MFMFILSLDVTKYILFSTKKKEECVVGIVDIFLTRTQRMYLSTTSFNYNLFALS